MGDFADTWEQFKKVVEELDKVDVNGKAKIAPKLDELVKKLESLRPKDANDGAAANERENWDTSRKCAQARREGRAHDRP